MKILEQDRGVGIFQGGGTELIGVGFNRLNTTTSQETPV